MFEKFLNTPKKKADMAAEQRSIIKSSPDATAFYVDDLRRSMEENHFYVSLLRVMFNEGWTPEQIVEKLVDHGNELRIEIELIQEGI